MNNTMYKYDACKVPVEIDNDKFYFVVEFIRDADVSHYRHGTFSYTYVPLQAKVYLVSQFGHKRSDYTPYINIIAWDSSDKEFYTTEKDIKNFFSMLRKYIKKFYTEGADEIFTNFKSIPEYISVSSFVTKKVEEYRQNNNLFIPEMNLSTALFLRSKSDIYALFAENLQNIYRDLQHLAKDELKALESFTLPYSILQSNLWNNEYKLQLLKIVLQRYKSVTGNYFIPYGLMTGMHDNVDLTVLKYVASIMQTTSMKQIHKIVKQNYRRFFGIGFSDAVKEFNNKQIKRIIDGKGLIAGYEDNIDGMDFIRCIGIGDVDTTLKTPYAGVHDVKYKGRVSDISKKHWVSIYDDDLITYNRVVPLPQDVEQKLCNFDFSMNEAARLLKYNRWNTEYKQELVFKLLKSYYRETGHYFVSMGLWHSVNATELDEKLINYISYIIKKHGILNIEAFVKSSYEANGYSMQNVMHDFNAYQKLQILKGKGKLVGYHTINTVSYNWASIPSVIRIVPTENYIKDSNDDIHDAVMDYPLWGNIDDGRIENIIVKKGSDITYQDVVREIGGDLNGVEL